MKRLIGLLLLSFLLAACQHRGARSEKCFDDIRFLVQGRTAHEIESILGHPDSRQPMPLTGERWIWWNYTYLDGKNYAPEERGRVVHLEIIFEPGANRSGSATLPASDLRVTDPISVSYVFPAGKS